jgi:hypothetical protein
VVQLFIGWLQGSMEYILDNQRALRVGDARVQKIASLYRQLGYLVWINPSNHQGVDLIIISTRDGRIKKVIEITNYSKKEYYVGNERFKRYMDSLTFYKDIEGIEMQLFISYRENLSMNQYQILKKYGIIVNVVGKQDLPTNESKNP